MASCEDDYEKLKNVGGGSYGQVFKARRKDNKDLICALKYVSKDRSSKDIRDARNEIYILERLVHKNIIQLLDSFETLHHIVLVCEYAVKELFRTVRNEWKGKFTEEKGRLIACQICSGLYYLHASKVLHRDLKPQNILITKDETIKICDFGFSKFMGDTYYAKTIQGTLYYMAPELCQDKYVHYTEKVDLWALGCIIYELCTGKTLFASRSLKEMCLMHQSFQLPKSLSDDIKSILRKLLVCDPHKRIPWPYILKHRWFKGGIEVSAFDLSRESPYTKPEIASEKRKEYHQKVKMIRTYRKKPRPTDTRDGEKITTEKNETETRDAEDNEATAKSHEATVDDTEVPAEAPSGTDFVDAGTESDAWETHEDLTLEKLSLKDVDAVDGLEDEEGVDTVILVIYEDEDEDGAAHVEGDNKKDPPAKKDV